MDELGGFEPTDTTGFIQIESIRIKKSVICSYHSFVSEALTLLSHFPAGGPKQTFARVRLGSHPRTCTEPVFKISPVIKVRN